MTAIEGLGGRGWVRRSGDLSPVPAAWKTRRIDFGEGKRPAITVPLADLSSAWHSTGIPDIEVYLAASPGLRALLVASRYVGPLLGSAAVRSVPDRPREGRGGRSERGAEAPRPGLRVGRGRGRQGRRAVSRLATPEGYTLTVRAALAAVALVLAGRSPAGFQTPATAFGPDFVLGIPGVTRTDV